MGLGLWIKGAFLVAVSWVGLFGLSVQAADTSSQTDPSKVASPQECLTGANIHTPFVHQKFYKGERELLGYNPRYYPGIFAFDELNRPYVRTPDGMIQTLDVANQWVKLDFKPAIKAALPDWDGQLATGPFAAEELIGVLIFVCAYGNQE